MSFPFRKLRTANTFIARFLFQSLLISDSPVISSVNVFFQYVFHTLVTMNVFSLVTVCHICYLPFNEGERM